MLFLSSLAAALAPVERRGDSSTSSTTSTTTQESRSSDAGELIIQSLQVPAKKPARINAEAGDQLQLRVTSRRSGTIELGELGEDADVGPDQPALFDVLLAESGDYPVRFLGSEDALATISVK